MIASLRPYWSRGDGAGASPQKPSAARGGSAFFIVFFIFTFVCLAKIATIVLSVSRIADVRDLHALLHTWGLAPDLAYRTSYPTAFTRDIHPRPIHSHNDYWRQVPLYSALAVGAISVEADVWEYRGELFVGHDAASLQKNRTFKSLYVDRIREILDEMNRPSEVFGKDGKLRGVFDTDTEQTLHLYVDLKTEGKTTLPVVIRQLEALRTPRNYLTHWGGGSVRRGQVTVHLTGDTPFGLMLANSTYRDYFYDAPLDGLESNKYNSTNSLMATAPFGEKVGRVFWGREITEEMLKVVRGHVKAAHSRGIGVRYWQTPDWPVSVRNKVWGTLLREGVDLLNVDDLRGAAMGEW